MDPVSTQDTVPSAHSAFAESTQAPSLPAARQPLISDKIRHPAWLWLTHVLPITLLLWSGQYTYSIIGGEMTAGERWASLAQGLVLAAIAVASAVIALKAQRRQRLLSNRECVALVLMSAIAMALSVTFTFFTVPQTVPEWIVSTGDLLSRFFCLGMPGAFYALLVLSSFPLRKGAGIEFAKAFGVVLLCVGGTFLFVYTLSRLSFASAPPAWLPEWLIPTLWVAVLFTGGLVMTGAVIRSTLIAYTSIRRLKPYWQQIFMFVLGVVGPIGGLWLNKSIAFPVDFQAPAVYILALLNGGLLMLPVVRSIFWHRAIWLAQCVMFPFSAYFLIVFLPWLPAASFALIAAGAGFLMLVPLVLGLVHGYRIVDGYREEVRDGKWWKTALAGLVAVLLLPGALGWSMWQDRETLNEALDYIYSPDYRKDITFPGDLGRLENSLQHLQDMKHGIFLPFISSAYNVIVFHNLVLPDAKIQNLQQAFFGGGPAQLQTSALLRSRSSWNDDYFQDAAPATDVTLDDVSSITTQQGAVTTTHLTLVMQNHGAPHSEYVTTIQIPEGVYVSNFGLYINNELVPARIVEKKTALWVYENIKTREYRDPGLLIYKSRTKLELHVFPFASWEKRQAEIELVHPATGPTPITLGDRTIELNPEALPEKTVVTTCATPSGSVAVAEGADLADSAIHRKPYLDVLIDCSKGSSYSAGTLAESLRRAREAFPDAEFARVSAVNYEARDIVSDLVPVNQLDAAAIQKELLQARGGFLEDRFLKRGLLQAYDLMQKGAPDALLRPQFVVISSQSQAALREGDLETFLRLAPDARVIYAQTPGASSAWLDMASHEIVDEARSSAVVLWRWANRYAVSLPGTRTVATFPGNQPGQPELYQMTTAQFTPASSTLVADPTSRFADGVKTWAAQDEASLNPSILQNGAAALIGLSKQTRILVPDSSFIAVESASQWRIMEEKEKLKLMNNQAFEFEEPAAAPEPSTWLLLVAGLVLLWRKKQRA